MNGTSQLDLFSAPRKRGRGPQVIQAKVNELILRLYNKGWQLASDLGAHTESDKRVLRAIAAASGGHIISGQAGYRLNFEATADENRTAVSWLKHQRDELDRRIVEIERVYHSKAIPDCLIDIVRASRPAA
jgi:hypothetical protein